ncbi:hypothetical protein [uncultured Chitinophaga sp.]|uniref:hypothetical protein n=1 Tax=uncultured Chitinophaga sp. TaxID=339340 RepID=UPI0025F6D324|nr:hypothetical protein [uncultured Chitinophaga sp.]
MSPAVNLRPWSLTEKFALRFFAVLFIFYVFPFPLDLAGYPEMWWNQLLQIIVPWIGTHVLHLKEPITIFPNGSGDTTYNYVLLLTQFVCSFIAAVIWSLMDGKRRRYDHLHYWLRVLVRYFLMYNMFVYGFAKVFHLQMGTPMLSTLITPLGDKSPMGLAWAYMGFSSGFSAITGWAEVIAGLLLIFRRTVTIGAIVNIVVTINIVAINFCFDVPVKLFSSMLLLMSVFLLAPDVKRLTGLFLFNKAVSPKLYPNYHGRKRWLRILLLVLKFLIVAYFLYVNVANSLHGVKLYGDERPLPTLYGIYDAHLIVRNNDTLPPLRTDYTRWNTLVIQYPNAAVVKLTNDSTKYFAFEVDTVRKTARVYSYEENAHRSTLNYHVKGDTLELSGKYFNDSVLFSFTKRDLKTIRLLNRGFHWINEHPYHR